MVRTENSAERPRRACPVLTGWGEASLLAKKDFLNSTLLMQNKKGVRIDNGRQNG